MKLALIGNGAMAHMVAAEARKRGDEIGVVLSSAEKDLTIDELAEKLRGHDAAIDFTTGDAVLKNIEDVECEPQGRGARLRSESQTAQYRSHRSLSFALDFEPSTRRHPA